MTTLSNLSFFSAQRSLLNAQQMGQQATQRLSSGLRINGAKDDAAGLAIAERMSAQTRGMSVAIRNANDAISLSQTAESALSNVSDALQRMRELAVQARNATNNDGDKDALDKEFGELAKEVQRVFQSTKFNNKAILGADAGALSFQVGAGTDASDSLDVTTLNMTSDTDIQAVAGTNISGAGRAVIDNTASTADIGTVIDDIDTALEKVTTERAGMGATQNRFDAVIKNLSSSLETQTAARSRIMDADFASETANLSRSQILQQASIAMLAQANQSTGMVLRLIA
jgi:flagellin